MPAVSGTFRGTVESVQPSKYPKDDGSIPWRLKIDGAWYNLEMWPCPVAEGDSVEFSYSESASGKSRYLRDIVRTGQAHPKMEGRPVSAPPAGRSNTHEPHAQNSRDPSRDEWICANGIINHSIAAGRTDLRDLAYEAVRTARYTGYLMHMPDSKYKRLLQGENPEEKPAESANDPEPAEEVPQDFDDDIPF